MINVTPDVLNRHADHLRYVYDNDGSADIMSAAAGRIAHLEAKVARLESRGINDMHWDIERYEEALRRIITDGGRREAAIAREALRS